VGLVWLEKQKVRQSELRLGVDYDGAPIDAEVRSWRAKPPFSFLKNPAWNSRLLLKLAWLA
jgi:hypothetical protein